MKIKSIYALAAAVLLAAAAGVTAIFMADKISSLAHENVAKNFSKGEEFAQLTLFLPESSDFTADKVMYLRYKLEKALTDKSMKSENGARLYVDAYSSYGDITIETDSARSVKSGAVYIGGDYGLFHNELEYSADIVNDINHDRILLSRDAAWRLYGGYDLYDFRLSDGKYSYLVSGVYTEPDTDEYKVYYGDKVSCVADMSRFPHMKITCYEIIMVNPVKNFAKDIVKEALGLDESTYLMVENSQRFSLSNLYRKIPELVKTDTKLPDGVSLTHEEMTARRTEKELAVMLLLLTIFGIYPVIYMSVWVFRLIMLIKEFINRHITSRIKDKFSYS